MPELPLLGRRLALANRHVEITRFPAPDNANRHTLADTIAGQQILELLHVPDNLAINRNQDIAQDDPRRFRRPTGLDRDDEEPVMLARAQLGNEGFWEVYRLRADAEVAAAYPTMLQQGGD
jgi:hypothetical protein